MADGTDICITGNDPDGVRNAFPLAAELESALEKPNTEPPKFCMAASKLSLVLVLGS